MLNIGDMAPDFSLDTDKDTKITLLSFLNKKNIVLYFYPKDDTPGCTKEACDFRDNIARLNKGDTVVLGVSKDTVASHKKFQLKYQLPFNLLSDVDHKVQELYGVWAMKKFMGREFMGTVRTTYLIDKAAKIRHIWRNVSVKGHVDEVAKAIESL